MIDEQKIKQPKAAASKIIQLFELRDKNVKMIITNM